MWRTPAGDRVLTDPEWEAFAAGLDSLRFQVECDLDAGADDAAVGVPVFDRLTPEQKLALLAAVAAALRDPDTPAPRHTAAGEAAIAAVFAALRENLEVELESARLEDGTPDGLRRLLRAAVDGDGPPPDPSDADPDVWMGVLDDLEGRVLWDDDHALGDLFLDLPPDDARAKLAWAGIDPDYFRAVPPDPGERGLAAARQTLARLLRLPVPNDDGLYPALDDRYHDLTVGPVSPAEASAWEDHPWVQVVEQTDPHWDCDYPRWAELFSGVLPVDPFELDQATSGAAADLPAGVFVERRGDGWVVRGPGGLCWCDPVDNGWAADDPDDDFPALTFPTADAARAAYARADRMYAERAARLAAACARLGITDIES